MEEAQNKLTALKNQLLLKTSQVADAKAELDHKTRSIQKINKCLSNYCWCTSRYEECGVDIEDSLMSLMCSKDHLS